MINRDNPSGVDDAKKIPHREIETNGEKLLANLVDAIREKSLVKLRAVSEEIKLIVETGECKCSPVGDDELVDILNGRAGYLAIVGTGSSGSRIVVGYGKIEMPFGETDEKLGYGKVERDAFKRLFGIPESEYPSISLPN